MSMDSSRGLDKMESSVARQITEPLVLLKFRLALPHTALYSKAALCVSVLFLSCAVRNRVEVSQIHYTSAVVCCKADCCLRKRRYSQAQGTPCSKPGGGQLPLEEERTAAPLLLPCRRKNDPPGRELCGPGLVPPTPGLWLSFSEILGQL